MERTHSGNGDGEDVPSDFFDDFSKEEFIEGLSIIDSWDDEGRERSSRRFVEKLDNVSDLRELLPDDRERYSRRVDSREERSNKRKYESPPRRSTSSSRLDDYIKPGSRRDPNKTNEAIRKDKKEKVKEYLAKSLESSDDLRPPGTELDDFFSERNKSVEKKKIFIEEPPKESPEREHVRDRRNESPKETPERLRERRMESPERVRYHQRWSPKHSNHRQQAYRSPNRRSPRRSPRRQFKQWRHPSPLRHFHYRGKVRHSPRHRSPRRHSPRYSPRRPRRSRSRSPYKRSYESRRSKSRSPPNQDSFLYPENMDVHPTYQPSAPPNEYHSNTAGYSYAPTYTAGFTGSYDYGSQIDQTGMMPATAVMPQMNYPGAIPNPVPAPIPNPNFNMTNSVPTMMNPMPTNSAPVMVPAPPTRSPSIPMTLSSQRDVKTPYDALAQLVAEGKISKEDYLKLAPNRGTTSSMDTKNRVMVLNRCQSALQKLSKLVLPNHLIMNCMLETLPDTKSVMPKFCSPLKRNVPLEFQFTKKSDSSVRLQNKQLIDRIIASVGLEKEVSRPKKKIVKNMKDASVQTTKPFCDVCSIRESTRFHHVSTSVDAEHFCSTVHTQVVEQDLLSSRAVFTPSGSVGEGPAMSIAHLTPAQLVSQLAARAKTLKQNEPPSSHQFGRNPPNNYDYEGRGQPYQNYNNYRY